MLSIQHLEKIYVNKKGVRDFNLTLQPGDLLAFIGPNGAGKTTTLKCIANLHAFDKGDILFNQISLKKEPLRFKQHIAYIPDNPDLYEFLTGWQYLNFIADVFSIDAKQREEKSYELCTKFELQEALYQPISAYSHGMKQKLALISALIHNPDLLILDEPFVGLDPKASLTLKNIMLEMCQQKKIIIFSTHVLEVAEKLANRVAIILEGKLVAEGSMQDIRGNQSLENIFMELADHA